MVLKELLSKLTQKIGETHANKKACHVTTIKQLKYILFPKYGFSSVHFIYFTYSQNIQINLPLQSSVWYKTNHEIPHSIMS